MRKSVVLVLAVLTLAAAVPAFADLQNVIVGGSLRIRGNWWTAAGSPMYDAGARNPLFQPLFPWSNPLAPLNNYNSGRSGLRPLGNIPALRWMPVPGRDAVVSPVAWNKDMTNSWKFVEQLTKVNVKADFTDQVAAFVEFDCYNVWGDNFRSNYITGADFRGGTNVNLRQAYIEANEIGGIPLRLRVGRQDLKLGSGWLIGNNECKAIFTGLSFDAVRATYETEQFSVDAIAAKLAENPFEEDGDTDLYAVYGSYKGIENITLDAYWMMVRDAAAIQDTNLGWLGEWWEDVLGIDNYDVTQLHTVGLRGAGTYGAIDFEAEVAYQFGDLSSTAAQFRLANGTGYGPDKDDVNDGLWGANLQVGYTFDMDLKPRVFAGGAYFGGQDERDLNFWQWTGAVLCPVWHPKASVSFNRLFSDWQYSNFVDAMGQACTNLWLAYPGVSVMPIENLTLEVSGAHVETLDAFKSPWATFWLLGNRVTLLQGLSFLDKENNKDMCWDVSVKATYAYSADLSVEAGYSHMFVDKGAEEGNYVLGNGTIFVGGAGDDDPDYFYVETKLSF